MHFLVYFHFLYYYRVQLKILHIHPQSITTTTITGSAPRGCIRFFSDCDEAGPRAETYHSCGAGRGRVRSERCEAGPRAETNHSDNHLPENGEAGPRAQTYHIHDQRADSDHREEWPIALAISATTEGVDNPSSVTCHVLPDWPACGGAKGV